MKTWQKLAATAAIWVVGQLVTFYLFWVGHGYIRASEGLMAACTFSTCATIFACLVAIE